MAPQSWCGSSGFLLAVGLLQNHTTPFSFCVLAKQGHFKRKIISINFKDKPATKRWCQLPTRQHPPPVQTALNSEQPHAHHQGIRDGAGGDPGSGDSRKRDVRAAPHTWSKVWLCAADSGLGQGSNRQEHAFQIIVSCSPQARWRRRWKQDGGLSGTDNPPPQSCLAQRQPGATAGAW